MHYSEEENPIYWNVPTGKLLPGYPNNEILQSKNRNPGFMSKSQGGEQSSSNSKHICDKNHSSYVGNLTQGKYLGCSDKGRSIYWDIPTGEESQRSPKNDILHSKSKNIRFMSRSKGSKQLSFESKCICDKNHSTSMGNQSQQKHLHSLVKDSPINKNMMVAELPSENSNNEILQSKHRNPNLKMKEESLRPPYLIALVVKSI
ncbi:hypothetical protein NPIL_287601 [Nephila pilipes]|uniref:Uncharacterized protein n=1 Tax=Nephila pilipes TaxID=299642 RepID=A0A8X6NMC9_NEPPI|nr:hypothetical protein NPIL_287601 [Nephila pilipes]